jgi:hypothetical protein
MAKKPRHRFGDPFIGTWKLDPEQSRYQFGTPPQSGTYHIEADGGCYLITMDWVDAQGKTFHQSYTAIPDGVQHPYDNADVAEFVSMTRLDNLTLDSATYKGGERIAYAVRTLSADQQTMTITQAGTTPMGGVQFENRAVYVRQA